jgi:chromosome segregation ATPase
MSDSYEERRRGQIRESIESLKTQLERKKDELRRATWSLEWAEKQLQELKQRREEAPPYIQEHYAVPIQHQEEFFVYLDIQIQRMEGRLGVLREQMEGFERDVVAGKKQLRQYATVTDYWKYLETREEKKPEETKTDE